MEARFSQKFFLASIDRGNKQWFPGDAVVVGDWAVGIHHLAFPLCSAEIATVFGKHPVVVDDFVRQLPIYTKKQILLYGFLRRSVSLLSHNAFLAVLDALGLGRRRGQSDGRRSNQRSDEIAAAGGNGREEGRGGAHKGGEDEGGTSG